MRLSVLLLALLLLFLAFAVNLYAQTCPTYDPDLPPNPPSQLNFDVELRQNYVHGSKALTLVIKNFPLYNKAGYIIMKNQLDLKKTLAQQINPSNNVDMQTVCSLSSTDRTVVCPDYAKQFSNPNFRVTKNVCNLNMELDLDFIQFTNIATFNSVLGTYDLDLVIGYYTKASASTGDVYWAQTNLARFSVDYQKFGSQQDKPYALTSSLAGRTLWRNSQCYAGYTSSIQSDFNATLFVDSLQLTVRDQGKMVDFTGAIDHSAVCSKKPSDISTVTCEGYVSMRSDDMVLTVSNGGRYCPLNAQKTQCLDSIPFTTTPLSRESKCAAAKTEVMTNSFPSLFLADLSDLTKKKVIASIGDTYILLVIDVARVHFKATNVKFIFKAKGDVKDLIGLGRAVIIADPTTQQTPSEYSEKVCIAIRLIDKSDGYFLTQERPLEMSVTWDLVPRVSSRADGEDVIDSQYNAVIVPEYTPQSPQPKPEPAGGAKVTVGLFIVALMILNFLL